MLINVTECYADVKHLYVMTRLDLNRSSPIIDVSKPEMELFPFLWSLCCKLTEINHLSKDNNYNKHF